MRDKIKKLAFELSRDLILESKVVLLSKDIDISGLVVYMQQVEKEKKKQDEIGERQGNKFRLSE